MGRIMVQMCVTHVVKVHADGHITELCIGMITAFMRMCSLLTLYGSQMHQEHDSYASVVGAHQQAGHAKKSGTFLHSLCCMHVDDQACLHALEHMQREHTRPFFELRIDAILPSMHTQPCHAQEPMVAPMLYQAACKDEG